MSLKGILAVSLFLGSVLIANAGWAKPTAFDWTPGLVVAGAPLEIKVTGAPCHPVTVTLTIGGYSSSGTISEFPGTLSLEVPAGTEGRAYTITVSCPDDRDSHTGQVL